MQKKQQHYHDTINHIQSGNKDKSIINTRHTIFYLKRKKKLSWFWPPNIHLEDPSCDKNNNNHPCTALTITSQQPTSSVSWCNRGLISRWCCSSTSVIMGLTNFPPAADMGLTSLGVAETGSGQHTSAHCGQHTSAGCGPKKGHEGPVPTGTMY